MESTVCPYWYNTKFNLIVFLKTLYVSQGRGGLTYFLGYVFLILMDGFWMCKSTHMGGFFFKSLHRWVGHFSKKLGNFDNWEGFARFWALIFGTWMGLTMIWMEIGNYMGTEQKILVHGWVWTWHFGTGRGGWPNPKFSIYIRPDTKYLRDMCLQRINSYTMTKLYCL